MPKISELEILKENQSFLAEVLLCIVQTSKGFIADQLSSRLDETIEKLQEIYHR